MNVALLISCIGIGLGVVLLLLLWITSRHAKAQDKVVESHFAALSNHLDKLRQDHQRLDELRQGHRHEADTK